MRWMRMVPGTRMINRWTNLILELLLIQGYFALDPITEEKLSEEWDQYNGLLKDTTYRLPTTTRPTRYLLTLTPYFENLPTCTIAEPFTFDGEVTIIIRALQPNVSEIVLHCNDLTISKLTVHPMTKRKLNLASPGQKFECQMPWSFLRINITSPLSLNEKYIIKSKFTGNLQTNMHGFYRSWYVDSKGIRRWMATTQFQPGYARKAFPCYDEPKFKSRFDITIIREAELSPSLSNMPIKSYHTLGDGRISETFYTTPITSTYLLAFIVSHYRRVASGKNVQRPFYVYARDNAGSTGNFALEVGEKLLVAMEEYTAFRYYNMTDKIIMQQVAIPDFSAGAMENWGLLSYRESYILYDPQKSNHYYRQRVANIVAHEIAHMWFGNLVTCAWWDNLWLNEGFARFSQYFLAELVLPDMGYKTRFIVEQLQLALLTDSFDNTYALTNPAAIDPDSVLAQFSTITYAKGASVLRMTLFLLSQSTYRKALQNYLAKNAYRVVEPRHLFDAFDQAANEDGALKNYNGITIEKYLKSWTEQPGHPLLTVIVNHATGRMNITQERWNITSGVPSTHSQWHIPITWTRAKAVDFENLKPSHIITDTSTTLERGTAGKEWVIFNKQQSGFYRVNYDSETWTLITNALRDPKTRLKIHEINRAQIVDDVFILARSGVLPYIKALNILSFLEFEDQYAPWIAAINGFNFVRRRLARNDTNLDFFLTLITKLSTAVTNRLGFKEMAGEPYMDGLLRMYVNTFLCNIGHEQCIEFGKTNFINWMKNGETLPANTHPWVYCTGLRFGDFDNFNFFWKRYLSEDLASEQVVMLQAAGCTTDNDGLQILLNAITAGDDDYDIRPQDYTTALNSAINSNDANAMKVFEWLKSNVDRTTKALGSISSPLSIITARLLTEEHITEVFDWIEANQAFIGNASYNTGVSGIATARANLQWCEQRTIELEQYFETGYVEEILEDETEMTITKASSTISNSAGLATLSFVILVVTVTLNLVYIKGTR